MGYMSRLPTPNEPDDRRWDCPPSDLRACTACKRKVPWYHRDMAGRCKTCQPDRHVNYGASSDNEEG